jgi:DNA repair protein RadD
MHLRPYQERIVNQIRATLGRGVTNPLVVAPTGAGKTAMFCHIASGAAAKKNRSIVLVHRQEILQQTLKSMHRMGITAGQIVAGRPMTSDMVQVASVQTLVRRLELVKRPDLIIVDECHHAVAANSWGRILSYWSNVPRIGFTATPQRLDGAGLRETFSEMIQGPTIRELVADGWLSFPVLYRPPEEVSAQFHVKRGDFDAGEQFQTMSSRKIVGDVIEHYRQRLDGQPVIVSCVSIEHARMMEAQFSAAGYRARTVWGDMPQDERDDAIKGLGDGSVQVVTFCDLIGEGVDVPIIAGVIMLRRTLSLSLYLQIVGRALRPYPGKDRAIILDHAGNYYLHGHVLDDRAWSLDGIKRAKSDKPPTTTTCQKCFGVWPGTPRSCPACGTDFVLAPAKKPKDIKVLAGELVEAGLPEDSADQAAAFVASVMRLDDKARQKAMLVRAFALAEQENGRETIKALAEAVGYKQGWAQWAWKYVNQTERRA